MKTTLNQHKPSRNISIRLIITFSLSFFLIASFSQSQLIFANKSTFTIDSIVINGFKKVRLSQIKPGEDKILNVNSEFANLHSIVPCGFVIYYNNLAIKGQCSRATGITIEMDSIYIFDNGISKSNNLARPTCLSLLFTNASNKQTISFSNSSKSIISISEITPRIFRIEFDYAKFQKSPDVTIGLNTKKYTKDLSFHRFDNWNDTLIEVWIENDSLIAGDFPIEKSKEYIIDIDIREYESSTQQNLESLNIKSIALVKTYDVDWEHLPTKRFAFDLEKLRSNPTLKLTFHNKKYKLNLKEILLNSDSNGSFYQITKNGLKRK